MAFESVQLDVGAGLLSTFLMAGPESANVCIWCWITSNLGYLSGSGVSLRDAKYNRWVGEFVFSFDIHLDVFSDVCH